MGSDIGLRVVKELLDAGRIEIGRLDPTLLQLVEKGTDAVRLSQQGLDHFAANNRRVAAPGLHEQSRHLRPWVRRQGPDGREADLLSYVLPYEFRQNRLGG